MPTVTVLGTSSFLTWTHNRTIDLHRFLRLLSFDRRLVDCVGHFHALCYRAKRSKLAVEMRARPNKNEKVSSRAIRFITARHRNDPAHVFDDSGFVRQPARHSLRYLSAPFFTCRKVSTLNDKPLHNRSEEHTSELQSPCNLVCRLLLELARHLRSTLFPYTTLFRSKNEKVSSRAIRFITARHRNDPAHVFDDSGFVRQPARHSLRYLSAPFFTCRKVSTLNDKPLHNAAEGRRIE